MLPSTSLCWRQYRKKVGIGSLPPPTHILGVEQNRNRNFVQELKFLFSSEYYWKYRHSSFNCQEQSQKNIFSLSLWNADISGSLQTKTRILILTQSFDSGSVQPLPSSPGSHPKLLPFVKSKSCRSPGGAKNKGGEALIFGGFDLLKDQLKKIMKSQKGDHSL